MLLKSTLDCRSAFSDRVITISAYYGNMDRFIVARNSVDMNAPEEQRYPRREPVDNCFNFILENIDYAINNGLPQSAISNEWGRITTLIAKKFKKAVSYYIEPVRYLTGMRTIATSRILMVQYLSTQFAMRKNGKQRQIFLSEAIQMAETKGVKLYKCSTNSSLTFADSLLRLKISQELYLVKDLRFLITLSRKRSVKNMIIVIQWSILGTVN